MGTIHERYSIISSHDRKSLSQLRTSFRYKAKKKNLEYLISSIYKSKANTKFYFCIFPCYSKEGWDECENDRELRINLHDQIEKCNDYYPEAYLKMQTIINREDGHQFIVNTNRQARLSDLSYG